MFTDPPYSIGYKSDVGNSYSAGKWLDAKKIFDDNKSEAEAEVFYTDVLKNLYEFTTDDASIYWWLADTKQGIANRLAWITSKWMLTQILIWLKDSIVFGRGQDYHKCYEPCFFGWKKEKVHFINKKLATYKEAFLLDPIDFADLADVWYQKRDATAKYVHPTQKPVRLAERALKKNSQPGDVVLDVFGGSGSTLMACEQMDRSCYMMELDPKFCDVIVDRWQKFTGRMAERV